MLGSISSYADSLASLAEIIGVNIVLSGDNAVVIALAARELPVSKQAKAIFGGALVAIVMRIALTFLAAALLQSPYLKLIGSVLLFWIGIKLLHTEENEEGSEIEASSNMIAAIRTIVIADLVMSLDNVLAVAAAAKGNNVLLILGLATSIPIVVFGAKILIRLIGRYPAIITAGGALIGYVSGEMAVSDVSIKAWLDANAQMLQQIVPISCAVLIVIIGRLSHGKAVIKPTPVADFRAASDKLRSSKEGE